MSQLIIGNYRFLSINHSLCCTVFSQNFQSVPISGSFESLFCVTGLLFYVVLLVSKSATISKLSPARIMNRAVKCTVQ